MKNRYFSLLRNGERLALETNLELAQGYTDWRNGQRSKIRVFNLCTLRLSHIPIASVIAATSSIDYREKTAGTCVNLEEGQMKLGRMSRFVWLVCWMEKSERYPWGFKATGCVISGWIFICIFTYLQWTCISTFHSVNNVFTYSFPCDVLVS